MRKFTFVLLILFVAAAVNSQPLQNLEVKARQIMKKNALISNQSHNLKPAFQMALNSKPGLKSAAATITLDSVVYRTYNTESSSWENVTRDVYFYNAQLQNTEWLEQDWNSTLSMWEDNSRIELELNGQGRVSEMMIYSAEDQGGELVPVNRIEAFYGTGGLPDSVLHYYPKTEGNWEVEARLVYHYNNQGQLTRMDMTSVEEDEGDVYLQVLRYEYTRNALGNPEKSSVYFIDEEFELLFSETVYFYDTSGRRNASEFSMINFFTFELMPVSRSEYSYDLADDISEEIISYFDQEEEDWVPEQRMVYQYRNLNFADVIFPSYINLFGINEEHAGFNRALAEINEFEMISGNWVESDKITFHYSDETSTSARITDRVHISVYPNPASEKISVYWNGYPQLYLEIFTLTGSKAMEVIVYPGREISISHLQEGLYIYKVLNNRHVIHSGKLIKK